MWEHLKPGSSPIDWCEGNYQVSANIAEFVNTLSNFLFLLLPPILIHLFRDYGHFINPAIHVIWVLLIVVGLSSAYFHATLSLIGQLLDELAILWVVAAAFALFFPKKFFPGFLNGSRKLFSAVLAVIAGICTLLTFWAPAVNAFALMSLCIPTFILLYSAIKEEKSQRIYRLGLRTTLVMVLAITCWILDKFFCDTYLGQKFPYLHAIWHVLIFISSYTACVLFAYYAVKEEYVNHIPDLRYWPVNEFELGIPFVSIKCYYSEEKRNI